MTIEFRPFMKLPAALADVHGEQDGRRSCDGSLAPRRVGSTSDVRPPRRDRRCEGAPDRRANLARQALDPVSAYV